MLSKFTRTKLITVNGKKRRAHRVLIERALGRALTIDEEVHHKNRNPLDNRLSNLEVMSKSEHQRLHGNEKQKYPDKKSCVVCGAEFTVNPKKRKRNKCCSVLCARSFIVEANKRRSRKLALNLSA